MTATNKLCDCTINTGCTKHYESELCLCRQNNDLPWAERAPNDQDSLRPILKQRGQEYGEYTVMCNKIQAIKSAYGTLAGLPPYQREALEMAATKIGRILTGNHDNEDSWRDVAGYFTLVADRIPKASAGQIFELPGGWEINKSGGFDHTPTKRHWGGDIVSLRKHLGMDE